jgi:hypothetical protein
MKYISDDDLAALAKDLGKSSYGQYLRTVLKEGRSR